MKPIKLVHYWYYRENYTIRMLDVSARKLWPLTKSIWQLTDMLESKGVKKTLKSLVFQQ